MKFSKKLAQQQAIALFRGQWVTYVALKNLIKELAIQESSVIVPEVFANQLWWFDSSQKASLGSIPPERISFIQIVEYEISKTSQFYASQRKRISDMLFEIQRRLEGEFNMDGIMQDIDTISGELVLFYRFIWQAKQLLLKITKKHDKFTKYKVNTWFLVRLEKEEFWNPKIDELVIGLSETYAVARQLTDTVSAEVKRDFSAATEDFVRKNEKYFIKPEDVLLVKLVIIRYLPLDIFELSKLKSELIKIDTVNLDVISGLQDNCVINSIYLDNDSHTMYHERTGVTGTKGNLIRIRWYGSHANPPSDCYMERKTRQVVEETETFKIDEAIKERFRVNERNIAKYLNGEWTINKKLKNMLDKNRISEKEAKDTLRKATSIQQEITSKKLNGSLRTVVRRSAFQRGGDQTLRLSLDTNLHIINERVEKDEGQWARDLNMPLRFDEVKTLPYAILEIKTQAEAPTWVTELKNSGYLIPAPHFSKFLYGSCKLWPDKMEHTPLWWDMLINLETTIPPTPAMATLHERIKHFSSVAGNRQVINNTNNSPLHEPPRKPLPPIPGPSKHKNVVRKLYSSDFLRTREDLLAARRIEEGEDEKKDKERVKFQDTAGNPHTTIDLEEGRGEEGKDTKVKRIRKFISKVHMPSMPMIHKREDKNNTPTSAPVVNKPVYKRGKSAKEETAEQRTAKVYFANERTLLSWLNTATFLSLTGITLLTTRSTVGRVAGIALTFVTVLFAIYALIKYMQRLFGITKKKQATGLYDKYGPVVLIFMFCAALVTVGVYFAVDPPSNNTTTTNQV